MKPKTNFAILLSHIENAMDLFSHVLDASVAFAWDYSGLVQNLTHV